MRALVAEAGIAWPETSFCVVVFRGTLKRGRGYDVVGEVGRRKSSRGVYSTSGGLVRSRQLTGNLYVLSYITRDPSRIPFQAPSCPDRYVTNTRHHFSSSRRAGGVGPWHVKGRRAGREMYERIVFEMLRFVLWEGVSGGGLGSGWTETRRVLKGI